MRHQFCSSASRFYYFCFISDEFHASSSDMLMLVLTSYISWLEKQLVGENRVRRAILLQYKSVFVWNNSDFINLRLLCVHEHTNKFSNHKKTVVTNEYWCINDTNLTVNLLIDESIDGQWILCDSIMFDIGFVGWFYCFFSSDLPDWTFMLQISASKTMIPERIKTWCKRAKYWKLYKDNNILPRQLFVNICLCWIWC